MRRRRGQGARDRLGPRARRQRHRRDLVPLEGLLVSKPKVTPDFAAQNGLDPANMPRHIAIIMDGNGRWAKSRGLPRVAGHKLGVDSVRAATKTCGKLGVEVLTLYAFSTENWLRPKDEVSELMRLLSWTLKREVSELDKNNVRLRASGRLDGLPKPVQDELSRGIEKLKGNTGLILNLALNYGSRQEIVDAVNALIREGAKEVDEAAIARRLYTAEFPDPDLVIRTSGEMRLSNFLLWQAAYAELYITPVLWPDFREQQLVDAVLDYQKRHRRFGGI
ncbi:MAG: isoprenyl transferase [Elusimicrobia bacterium]|nr:isoprenyl transferase [Elusimicrobiota bacterium]